MVEPTTIMAAANVLKPETLNAAGGVLKDTGTGVKTIFSGITDPMNRAHETEASRSVEEAKVLATMSPEQMKVYLDHKKAASGSSFRTLASFTPLGPVLAARDLFRNVIS